MEKGLIHIYTGDGKGKTTAAIGLSIRAAGAGMRIVFAQFLKFEESSEHVILKQIDNITLLTPTGEFGFYFQMSKEDKNQVTLLHNEMLHQIQKRIQEGSVDLLVLDEITYAYEWGLVDRAIVDSFIFEKPSQLEVVITGRNPSQTYLDRADYITEMKAIRHPFDKNILSRKGIEF